MPLVNQWELMILQRQTNINRVHHVYDILQSMYILHIERDRQRGTEGETEGEREREKERMVNRRQPAQFLLNYGLCTGQQHHKGTPLGVVCSVSFNVRDLKLEWKVALRRHNFLCCHVTVVKYIERDSWHHDVGISRLNVFVIYFIACLSSRGSEGVFAKKSENSTDCIGKFGCPC